jgi:hypothetical protein
MGVGGLFVKYVLLTSTPKTGKKTAENPPGHAAQKDGEKRRM